MEVCTYGPAKGVLLASRQRSISSGAMLCVSALGSLGVQLWDPGRAIARIALLNLGSIERSGRDGLQLWDERVAVFGAMETLGEEVQGEMVERLCMRCYQTWRWKSMHS